MLLLLFAWIKMALSQQLFAGGTLYKNSVTWVWRGKTFRQNVG